MTNRREFLKTAACAPGILRNAGKRPNILIVMTDQHRAGFTRGSGFPLDTMPALDRLAAGGVRFERAYCTSPACGPSRVSLMTGRWPHAHRVRQNSGIRQAYFETDLLDVFRPMGYRIGLVGKNDTYLRPGSFDFFRPYEHREGWKPPNAPAEYAAIDNWLTGLHSRASLEPAPFPPEVQYPYRIVSDTIEFLGNNRSQPFLLWVSIPEPHPPYQASKPYFDLFPPESVPARAAGPEVLASKGFKWRWMGDALEATYPGYDKQWRHIKSIYLGSLRMIDDQIGRLTAYLRANNLMENTIVVFLADHGDYVTDYGLLRKGVGMPEALVRIPMIWAGCGIQGGHESPAHVSIADVMPTLCEAAGAEIPHGSQGRSLWPLLQGGNYPTEEFRSIYAESGFGGLNYSEADHLPFSIAWRKRPGGMSFDSLNACSQSGYLKMVRMGRWKLLFDMMGTGELYDLETDPYELKNRFDDPTLLPRRTELLAELLRWTIRTQDTLPTANYPTKWAARNWYAPYEEKR